jgi:hypothetical protein
VSKDNLGNALVALNDIDGDGFRDLACAGALSDNPTTDCGTLKGVRLFPTFPSTYCTAKLNSLGCTPSISWKRQRQRQRADSLPDHVLEPDQSEAGLPDVLARAERAAVPGRIPVREDARAAHADAELRR